MQAEKFCADGIELDVQLTKDGEVVVIHDETIDRTTNGKGFVKDYTLAELQKFDASYTYKKFGKRNPIPTLEEVLQWLQSNHLYCNIELKSGTSYEELVEKVIYLVRSYRMSERIIVSSFNHYSIVHSYRLAPEVEIAPLYREGLYMPWIYAGAIHAKAIHPNFKVAPDFIIKSSLKHGIKVRPYTVNNEKEMKRLFSLGCSAIITDELKKAVQYRKQ